MSIQSAVSLILLIFEHVDRKEGGRISTHLHGAANVTTHGLVRLRLNASILIARVVQPFVDHVVIERVPLNDGHGPA